MELDRRSMLKAMGAAAVVGGLSAAVTTAPEEAKAEEAKRFEQQGGDFSWKYQSLDAKESTAIAYDGYWHKGYGCAYGTFYGIVGVLAEKYGAPYNAYPFSMMEAFKGGISDWGTICGALAGAACAISCFYPRKEAKPMVNELFRWYEKTAFPMYNPGDKAKGVKGEIPTSVSNSVLCHVSVSRWATTTGLAANSKERSERCGRITADVCAKTIEILEAKLAAGANYKGTLPKQESVSGCTSCHTKGGMSDTQKGNMSCDSCHSGSKALQNKFENHPEKK